MSAPEAGPGRGVGPAIQRSFLLSLSAMILDSVRPGDVLIVVKLDHLARLMQRFDEFAHGCAGFG